MVRPNIGTVAGGAWVWDDTAHLPWDVLYSANYSALQLPPEPTSTTVELPTGVASRWSSRPCATTSATTTAIACRRDLRFEGVMPPQPLTAVGSTFGSAHHFDQFGRVTGELVVHGERIEIDCIGMRDRTWGPRPEHRPRQAAYVTGAASAGARVPGRDEHAARQATRSPTASCAVTARRRASPAASGGSSATRARAG